jgi:hypothetical protein
MSIFNGAIESDYMAWLVDEDEKSLYGEQWWFREVKFSFNCWEYLTTTSVA